MLRAIEAVDLVAEEDRAAAFDLAALLGLANDLAHARHAFGHGAERHEGLVGVAGEQTRERRLAAARRAPQHHARDRALLDRLAQRLAGAEQLLVAQEIVERFGPQPMGEGCRRGFAGRGGDGEQLELVGHVFGHLARILLVAPPRDAFPVAARRPVLHSAHGHDWHRPALRRHHCGGHGASSLAGVAGGQEERETHKPALHGKHWVAITGKPLAATAGALTFARGGNAVDAACAMLAAAATMWDTLSWGGETQALIFDPRSGAVRAINALGVAPTGATPEFFRSRGLHAPARVRPARGRDAGHAGRLARHAGGVRHVEPRRGARAGHADGGRLSDGADADRRTSRPARSCSCAGSRRGACCCRTSTRSARKRGRRRCRARFSSSRSCSRR